jgi:hypothetical protein
MIRDFHSFTKKRLYDEIDALKGIIPKAEREALDSIRSLSNIGAHMEEDVNLIVDIDDEEAQENSRHKKGSTKTSKSLALVARLYVC